jgi:hypothetical protein
MHHAEVAARESGETFMTVPPFDAPTVVRRRFYCSRRPNSARNRRAIFLPNAREPSTKL